MDSGLRRNDESKRAGMTNRNAHRNDESKRWIPACADGPGLIRRFL